MYALDKNKISLLKKLTINEILILARQIGNEEICSSLLRRKKSVKEIAFLLNFEEEFLFYKNAANQALNEGQDELGLQYIQDLEYLLLQHITLPK